MSGLTLIGGSALDFTAAGSLIQEKGKELLTKFLVFQTPCVVVRDAIAWPDEGQGNDKRQIKTFANAPKELYWKVCDVCVCRSSV